MGHLRQEKSSQTIIWHGIDLSLPSQEKILVVFFVFNFSTHFIGFTLEYPALGNQLKKSSISLFYFKSFCKPPLVLCI
jgi:hypothetical protein